MQLHIPMLHFILCCYHRVLPLDYLKIQAPNLIAREAEFVPTFTQLLDQPIDLSSLLRLLVPQSLLFASALAIPGFLSLACLNFQFF